MKTELNKRIKIKAAPKIVFEKFTRHFGEWWPKEYTWSGEKLETITLPEKVEEFCNETGPNGFSLDWGTVIQLTPGKNIEIKWQIGPKREPVPDPAKASNLRVEFIDTGNGDTEVSLRHYNFKNHGEGYEDYAEGMDSEYGWDYLLRLFKEYCEK